MKATVRVPFFKDFAYIEYELDSEKDLGDQQNIVDVAADLYFRTDAKNAKPALQATNVREHEHLSTSAVVPAQSTVPNSGTQVPNMGTTAKANKPYRKATFKGPYTQAAPTAQFPHSPKCKQCGNIISPGMTSYYDTPAKVRLCPNCYNLFAD